MSAVPLLNTDDDTATLPLGPKSHPFAERSKTAASLASSFSSDRGFNQRTSLRSSVPQIPQKDPGFIRPHRAGSAAGRGVDYMLPCHSQVHETAIEKRLNEFHAFLKTVPQGKEKFQLNGTLSADFQFTYKNRDVRDGRPIHYSVFLQRQLDEVVMDKVGREAFLSRFAPSQTDDSGKFHDLGDSSSVRNWLKYFLPVEQHPEVYPVAYVLERRADVLATASIDSGPNASCVLEAVHMAAGFGCITALEALAEFYGTYKPTQTFEEPKAKMVCDDSGSPQSFSFNASFSASSQGSFEALPFDGVKSSHYPTGASELLNRPSYYCKKDKGSTREKGTEFYTPVHDAVYCGKPESVEWLLRHRADPNAVNKDGRTLLHHLAFRGDEPFLGTVFRGMRQAETLEWLVKLLLEVNVNLQIETKKDISPPSHCGKTPLEISALPGSQFPSSMMYLLAPSCQPDVANTSVFEDIALLSNSNVESARILAQHISSNVELHRSVRLLAQRENAVDVIANLLYTSPKAAVHILRILTVPPVIKDAGHNPLSKRACLAGKFGGLFDTKSMKCTYQQDVANKSINGIRWPEYFCHPTTFKGRPWHKGFAPVLDVESGRNDFYDVIVDVVLLPNLMDVDIMWALTCTWPGNIDVFEKKAIRAIIVCLWDNLIFDAYLLCLSFDVAVVCALLVWALSRDADERHTSNSSRSMPICHAILSATVLKELFFIVWRLWHHVLKGRQSRESTNVSTLRYQSMWSLRSFYNRAEVEHELACALLMACFLVCVELRAGHETLNAYDEILLAANVVYRFFRIGSFMRAFPGLGPSCIAIGSSIVSNKIQAMLAVTIFYWTACSFALISLARNHNYEFMLVNAYRGLIFGDGTGFDNLNLLPGSDAHADDTWDHSDHELQAHHYAVLFFMMFGTIALNVVLMNLIIAVYGSEYEKFESKSMLMFEQERARYSCKLLMIVPNLAETIERKFYGRYGIYVLALVCFMFGFSYELIILPLRPEILRWIPASAAGLAAGQGLLLIAWLRCDWFPPDEHFAFASNFETKKSQENDFFLWVCSRSDYREDFISAGDAGDDTSEKIAELHDSQEHLSARIDEISNTVNQSFEGVDSQLQKLMHLVENLGRQMNESTHLDARSSLSEKSI